MSKQFIVLTTIKGNKIAIRPSDIIIVKDCGGERHQIIVKTKEYEWSIDCKKHSVEEIVQEIEEINYANKEDCNYSVNINIPSLKIG